MLPQQNSSSRSGKDEPEEYTSKEKIDFGRFWTIARCDCWLYLRPKLIVLSLALSKIVERLQATKLYLLVSFEWLPEELTTKVTEIAQQRGRRGFDRKVPIVGSPVESRLGLVMRMEVWTRFGAVVSAGCFQSIWRSTWRSCRSSWCMQPSMGRWSLGGENPRPVALSVVFWYFLSQNNFNLLGWKSFKTSHPNPSKHQTSGIQLFCFVPAFAGAAVHLCFHGVGRLWQYW